MKDVAIYLRRSVADEDNPGAVSYDQQLTRCREIARGHGADDPDVLVDWGRSGGEGKEHRRPQYQELRRRIVAGQIRWIVSYDLSRLSRSTKETLDLIDLAQRHGARVHVGDIGIIAPDDPAGTLTYTNLAATNKFLRDIASKRSKEHAMARKAQGLPIGLPPYGELPGEDRDAVLRAFEEAGSYHEAARRLNADGKVRTRRGGLWSGRTVWTLVQRWRKETGALRATGQPRVRSRGRYYLTGLAVCHCGARMRVMGSRWSPQLVCPRGLSDPKHPRPIYVAEPKVLEWVRAEASRLRLPDEISVEVAADEALMAKLDRRRAMILDMYEDQVIDKAERDRRLLKVTEERERVAVRETVIQIPQIDWSWPAPQLNEVLRAIFDRIDLGRDLLPVSATWRVPEWRA